jgi:glycosyltransferase involved in cell wall biosynthesis
MINKEFLLIAFKFPPYAGVGGFRWSKLSKYLARLGHKIHVVTVDWRKQGPNTLLEDVQHPNITIHRIPSGYPHNLRYRVFKNRWANNIKNGLFLYVINLHFYYDGPAQYWGRHLLPYCEELLRKESIEIVVATGAPFQANRWAAVLKRRNPHIRLVQDFRDPWTGDALRTWPKSKSPKVRAWQKMSVEEADCVVAVTNGVLKLFLDGTRQMNGYVIRNGYDPDYKIKEINGPYESGFSFIYVGDVASYREEPLKRFLEAVRKVRDQIPGIRVTLVGGYRKVPETHFSDLLQDGILLVRPYIPQKAVFEVIKQHRYALQLIAKEHWYALSTKIYEYGMLKVPTVSINYGGEVTDLIRSHDLGYSINVEKQDIAGFLVDLYRQPRRHFSFDVADFAYDNLALCYSRLINDDVKSP